MHSTIGLAGHSYLGLLSNSTNSTNTTVQGGFSCLDSNPPLSCYNVSQAASCSAHGQFKDLSTLQAAAHTIPNWCLAQYSLGALESELQSAVNNYTATDNGYDSVFSDYQKYIKSLTPGKLKDFVFNDLNGTQGAPFFDCTFYDSNLRMNITKQTCPLSDYWRKQLDYTIYFELKPNMEANYSAALQSKAGISRNWTENSGSHTQMVNNKCSNPNNCPDATRQFIGFPVPLKDYYVPNPKDVVDKLLPKMPKLLLRMRAVSTAIATGFWNGSTNDAVTAFQVPVFLFVQAIETMATAKAEGTAEEKQLKKAHIMRILFMVFGLIPFLAFAGELLEPLLVFTWVVAIAGDTGMIGTSLYVAMKDPALAPWMILSILLSEVDIAFGIYRIAKAVRKMPVEEVDKLGTIYKAKTKQLDTIVEKCAAK